MRKSAIVTGGARGIGYGVVRALAADGFSIVIISSSPPENYAANLQSLTDDGVDFIYLQGNLADTGDIQRCINIVAEQFQRIDVLVNNAGVAPSTRTDLLEMSVESFDHVVGINTRGTMFMSQAVSKLMIRQQIVDDMRGILINISSISAEISSINRGEYCVSKAGVSMLTKLYADRLSSERIYVYEVRPGIIQTEMTVGVKVKYDELFMSGGCPIPRWGQPSDIGEVVSALSSGKFKYTTGQVIDVDGGLHIQRL